ncbi:MAG: methyltransferase domain-containing protein [Patescibacteria group bacterium]
MQHTSLIQKIYQKSGRAVSFDGTLKVYNLGAGKQDFPGTIAVDWNDMKHLGIKHDLGKFPWPIEDNSADVVLAFHFIEHMPDLFKTFEEIYRISKNGTKVLIEVPHFRHSSSFKDPTHCNHFSGKTINYFCKNNHTFTNLPFTFNLVERSFGWPAANSSFLKKKIKAFLERHIDLYENYLHLFWRVNILVFELEVVK